MRRQAAANVLVCAALVALADGLFYRQPLGWTPGAYAVLLAAAILRRKPRNLLGGPAKWVALLLAGLVVQLVRRPSLLALLLAALAVVSLSLVGRFGWTSSFSSWLARWRDFTVFGWLASFRDLSVSVRWSRRRGTRSGRSRLDVLKRWAIPALVSLVFVGLLTAANPVIDAWLENFAQWTRERIEKIELDFLRVGFWILVSLWIWALLRPPIRRPDALRISRETTARRRRLEAVGGAVEGSPGRARGSAGPGALLDEWLSPAAVLRSLLLFNAIFAVQSALDVYYLFAGAELPAGMTYATYAHRGAYPLVATALLAAVFVLVTFRAGGEAERSAASRSLVFLWIAQNVFLTVTAAWRLGLYIDAYSLTRLRVAAGIWMFLVAAGLFWICWRILRRRSNLWLVNANAVTALAVLYACALVDFGAAIAWYNVQHSKEVRGEGPSIDLAYLRVLGEGALPAVSFLAERPGLSGTPVAKQARELERELLLELGGKLDNWRGWSLARARLSREYLEMDR